MRLFDLRNLGLVGIGRRVLAFLRWVRRHRRWCVDIAVVVAAAAAEIDY